MDRVQVVWLKKDLRVSDHRPLAEAAARGPVVALFLYEDELIAADDFSGRHLRFLNDCLRSLQGDLQSLGLSLLLRRGNAVEVLRELHRKTRFTHLWSHEETGNGLSYRRDLDVADWCRSENVDWTEIPQTGVIRRLRNRDGWAASWNRRMSEPLTATPKQFSSALPPFAPRFLDESEFGLTEPSDLDLQRGGRSEALSIQGSFLEVRGTHYRREMSSPVTAPESCSRMSPYFTFGCLSIREAYQVARDHRKTLQAMKQAGEKVTPGWMGSLQSYLGRLRWHCHFMQKLEDEPEIEFRNFSRTFDGLREDDWNESHYQAWCAGQTGYPLVDAVMRCLAQTGWINFRMRAMVMSFASYHLWLHWRRTSLHLARVFTDYEPGIHYSQAQMQSGVTGINTVRIYSPIKQAQDQDPRGEFIRRWVPELEGVPDDLLAEPHRMTTMEQSLFGCVIGADYPAPIVDHATAYQSARQRIHAARSTGSARTEARRVQRKHGSRKQPTRAWR